MADVLKADSFPEPRLAIFKGSRQRFIVAEKQIIFEIMDFNVPLAVVSFCQHNNIMLFILLCVLLLILF